MHTIEQGLPLVFSDIRACKEACTCPSLTSRSFYFEPNPVTLPQWRRQDPHRQIDRRVVFVCESPGPSARSRADDATPARCWCISWQDERFERAMVRYGFADCYITNTVKCGERRGGRHTDAEIAACRPFLIRELELLNPRAVVAVGKNALWTLRQRILPHMAAPPLLFCVTHYSARCDVDGLWAKEFPALQRRLAGPVMEQ